MIRLLEVTLRDGGYVNDWKFGLECARKFIDGIYAAGIRDIEIGILGQGRRSYGDTLFNSFDQIKELLIRKNLNCNYYVMMNQADSSDYTVPQRSNETPDIIRLAYFKNAWKDAVKTAEILQEKGYGVFLQAMATFLYDEYELQQMITAVNQVRPRALYLVDSFGTMYNEEVRNLLLKIDDKLSKDILLGFHAHNNMQMALSNTIAYINTLPHRKLMTDASIFGMGRGAGNTPLELLAHYTNKHCGTEIDITKLLTLYEECISSIYKQYEWGYSIRYFITALKESNPVYGWYLSTKGIDTVQEIERIIEAIPPEKRFTLYKQLVDEIIETKNK